LLLCRDLELAVPGTYRAGNNILNCLSLPELIYFINPDFIAYIHTSFFFLLDAPVVTISSFSRQLVVITSKQRPRKLTIHGNDGEDYAFLLKGHEDLRQDERVMQVILKKISYALF